MHTILDLTLNDSVCADSVSALMIVIKEEILYIAGKYYPRIYRISLHIKNIAERVASKHDVAVFVPYMNP